MKILISFDKVWGIMDPLGPLSLPLTVIIQKDFFMLGLKKTLFTSIIACTTHKAFTICLNLSVLLVSARSVESPSLFGSSYRVSFTMLNIRLTPLPRNKLVFVRQCFVGSCFRPVYIWGIVFVPHVYWFTNISHLP